MSRFIRNTAILAKVETTRGTDSVPVGTTNAVLVQNMTINPLNATNIDRALMRPFYGASEQLPGSAYVSVEFEVEFQSSGSMTTPTIPAWDALLQGAMWKAGLGTAGQRVEYDPLADYTQRKYLTIYYYDDGVLHKLLGAQGTFSITARIGEIPKMKFSFMGVDGGISAAVPGTVTLTTWQRPNPVTEANTGAVTLGCTYATGALTGGTEYTSTGLELDWGNKVDFNSLLGTATESGDSIDISDRAAKGKVVFFLTAAQEVSFMASVKAGTSQSLGLVHGTATGRKMLIYAPAAQLFNPSKQEKNGRRLIGYDVTFMPVNGNDELKIVAL
jgi:hypothetical protein